MPRPNPFLMVQDTTMNIDEELLRNQLEKEKKRRMLLGDDDLLKVGLVGCSLKHVSENPSTIKKNIQTKSWLEITYYNVINVTSQL